MRKRIRLLTLVYALFCLQAFGQEKMISGNVTSSDDTLGIPGVSVFIKGTSIGTSTDIDGNYKISVPATTETLSFSAIGMKSREVTIGTQTTIDLVMDPDVLKLQEVVVTALGIEREKRSLGYSTQQVSGDEIVKSKESNVVNSLAGKVAGVQVQSSAGTPGASSKIYLRGANTFVGDNQPLFVVDGVPYDNTTSSSRTNDYPFNEYLENVNFGNRALDIDPNDIESINVLKGPQAAVLYGEKGSNGAIIITTKKAKYGQATKVEVSSNMGWDQVNKLPKFQNTYAQGNGGNYSTWTPGPDGLYNTDDDPSIGTPNSWGPKIADAGLTAYDNVDEYFQTGTTFTNAFSITSGSEKNAYRFSASHMDQKGIIPNTDFKRFTAHFSARSQLSTKVDMNASVTYANDGGNKAQQGSNTSGTMLALFRTPASFNLAGGENFGWEYPNGAQYNYYGAYDNPYWSAYNNTYEDNNNRINGYISANYYPMSWLRFTLRTGIDTYFDHRKGIYAVGSNNSAQTITGQITEHNLSYQNLYTDLIANLTRKITDNINLNAIVGGNISQTSNESLIGRGRNLASPKFYNLGNASELYSQEYQDRSRTSAFFMDLNFSWKDMIFVGLTGRKEWSSTLGVNNRSIFYPGVNAAFVLTEIGSMKENKILSFAKIRGSYASAARSGFLYPSYQVYTKPFFTDGFTNGFAFPYLGQNGYGAAQTIYNPDLKHEVTSGPEFGAELKFFQDRIGLDVTYYDQKTKDVIVSLPIPYSSGYWNRIINAGKIQNKGWEITASFIPVKTKDFEWMLGVNYAKNENKVLELPGSLTQFNLEVGFGDPDPYAILNEPYGSLFGTYWERNSNGDLLIDDDGFPIPSTDTKILGNPFPDYIMGFNNTFTYKNLTLSALLEIKKGGEMWNGTQARLNRIGRSEGSGQREQDYVVEGVHADGSANTTPISGQDYWQVVQGDFGATENQIQETGWVRLREVSISYRLGKVKFMQSIEITLSGRNLWLDTDYTGVDPETSLTGAASNYQGIDWFAMPNTKSYNVGVKLTF